MRFQYLHWHQDVAYFPLKPNNQIAVWFPLEAVTKRLEHLIMLSDLTKKELKAQQIFIQEHLSKNENRDLIPQDPAKEGYEVRCMEMNNTDLVCHNGYTWHYSGPNKKKIM